jgi:anti-sigma regulatory factor (Ser/Thr protein kinase)
MVEYRRDVAPHIAEIPPLIAWIEACCSECAVDGDTPVKLALALEEAVANLINHAFADQPAPHRIAIELTIEPDRVSALVIDNGRPFDPTAAPEPDRSSPLETRDVGGLGIHLIRQTMDRVDYRRTGDENRLRLEKARR